MRSYLRTLLIAIFLSGLSFGAAEAKSKSSTTSREAVLEQRLEELEQKQKILERNLELKEETEKEKAKEKPVIKAGTGGISIGSADGNNEIRFRGLIQADARFYLDRDGQGAVNTFILRRVRPYIEGKFAKRFEFRIMPDFGEGKVQLIDAYINTVIFPELKIQVGKQKEPVGLERLESASALHFVERGFPTELAPNRDLGVMLNGEILGGVLTYQAGVFNGVADGASADFDINNSKDFAGRVFAHPFKKTSIEPLKGLGVGVSGSVGQGTGTATDTQLG
ncbi:MAG TPA: porin, partial [bacterium]|nr:porin [bacterium]